MTVVADIDRAIEIVRPDLDPALPVKQRLRNLWAAAMAARRLASTDVLRNEFMQLAHESGLARDLGKHAEADLDHVIRWALMQRDPF